MKSRDKDQTLKELVRPYTSFSTLQTMAHRLTSTPPRQSTLLGPSNSRTIFKGGLQPLSGISLRCAHHHPLHSTNGSCAHTSLSLKEQLRVRLDPKWDYHVWVKEACLKGGAEPTCSQTGQERRCPLCLGIGGFRIAWIRTRLSWRVPPPTGALPNEDRIRRCWRFAYATPRRRREGKRISRITPPQKVNVICVGLVVWQQRQWRSRSSDRIRK